jgi:F420-dependent methylenetetrahydromethanopterin dehydrogenase
MNHTEMSIIELRIIKEKLDFLISKINKLQKNKLDNLIIDNADFIQLMNISNSTAKNWRNKGIIAYSQIKSKFYYKVADVKLLLENNYFSFKAI